MPAGRGRGRRCGRRPWGEGPLGGRGAGGGREGGDGGGGRVRVWEGKEEGVTREGDGGGG
ncbi:hypothetical protein CSW38_09675 [Thermus scotoductus]|uniref:Uncharacterized protein n=1 Tax=Thermus scotoductus TaxID=37636 RepID=A0A430RVE0_THESC|nr:hypothetical protein CSW38_09675 [Thermus scotoductus]